MNTKELLKSLTREEKIGQMLQIAPFFFVKHAHVEVAGHLKALNLTKKQIFEAGSVLGIGNGHEMIEVQQVYLKESRHKIPLLFMADIIHGYETIFPVPLGLASSFHPELAKKVARISALEAATSGIHVTFSPMADLSRDPRWGRVVESFGEDPYLNGQFSSAMVEGYQGNDLKQENYLASCVKHYAAYGKSEAGRDYNTVDLSRLSLHYDHMEGYRKAIEVGARLIMTSFNVMDGIPSTVNKYLLRDVLRDLWHFTGVTITDYDSLHQVIAHGVAEDDRQAAQRGIDAGLDIEMASTCYVNYLSDLVDQGVVDEKLIDEACLRILDLKEELGLFDQPFKHAHPERAKDIVRSKEHLTAARHVAHESMVLLENKDTLPLKRGTKIALVGPYATKRETNGPWSWHGNNALNANLYEALREDLEIVYVNESETLDDYSAKDLEMMKTADVLIYACGETIHESGEAHNRAKISLPREQEDLYHLFKAHAKKMVTIIFAGRPLILNELTTSDALIYAWFPGSEGAYALSDMLLGRINFSAKLPMSFPRHEGQIPLYYNHLNTGRPYDPTHRNPFTSYYLDVPNTPLYPFGYGLSYTTFVIDDSHLSSDVMTMSDKVLLTVSIKNKGQMAGQEVVQVYVRDRVAWIARPIKELKAFQKVMLLPSEQKTLTFTIDKHMLGYHNQEGQFVVEPGQFDVMVGTDSDHLMIHKLILKKE